MNEQLFTNAVIAMCHQLRRIANELECIKKKLPDRLCEDQPGVDVNDFVSMLEKGLQDAPSLRNQD